MLKHDPTAWLMAQEGEDAVRASAERQSPSGAFGTPHPVARVAAVVAAHRRL